MRFELLRRGRYRARLVPPPALTVDPKAATREGLKRLLGRGWCKYEFDTKARNGNPKSGRLPAPATEADSAELVN